MNSREQYAPGPATSAKAQKKEGDKWTLVLVRELRHAPEKVWEALTDPAQLREWAPYDADRNLATLGTAKLNWVGAPQTFETKVTRADKAKLLEHDDIRWELEAMGAGTRLTLWANINRNFISMGASGWHVCFEVLDQLLGGTPLGRIAGPEAMQVSGWQRLNAEYAKELGVELPNWPSR